MTNKYDSPVAMGHPLPEEPKEDTPKEQTLEDYIKRKWPEEEKLDE